MAVVAGLALLSGCAYRTATTAERAGIMAALQTYATTNLGAVILNADSADVKVRDNKAEALIVVAYPGGQVASSQKHASLFKKEGLWVVKDVEPKQIWK